jgi:geranylgeranyl diphosphate synthase, type II
VGAALAGQLHAVAEELHAYSEALGVAYQIRDDLDDLGDDSAAAGKSAIRPSIVLAMLRERGEGEVKQAMEAIWSGSTESLPDKATVRQWALDSGAHEKAMLQLEGFKEAAIRSLQPVDNANLKGLLRRVIGKIFNDLEIKGWCREFEVKNQPEGQREPSAVASGDGLAA